MTVATAATNLSDHVGTPLDRPLRVAVVGLGGRGSIYAGAIAAEHRGVAEVVQIAEPRPWHRDQVADSLGLGADGCPSPTGTTSSPASGSPTP